MSESRESRWFPWACLGVGVAVAVFGRIVLFGVIDSEPAAGVFLVPLCLVGPACFILGATESLLRTSGKLSIPTLMNLVALVLSIYFLFAPLWLR